MSTSHHSGDASAIPAARVGVEVGARLQELEAVIERGKHAFLEVGRALLVIRDERRYKERGFRNFDDYCHEHWGFSRTNANRLIEAAAVAEEVVSMDTSLPAPANVRQTRELAKVPEGERAEVWAEVVEQSQPGAITAASIRDHVEARKPLASVSDTTTEPTDPAAAYFKAGDKAHRDRFSELFRLHDGAKPCRRADWELLPQQVTAMTPLQRQMLSGCADTFEHAAQQIRQTLETKLEVVK